MNTYINYDLHITQKGEDYHLRADCSLAGQETGQCTIPFSDEEIQGLLWQDMAFNPKEIGRRLYDAIFQHNMGIHLRTCLSTARAQKENLRIRLHLNESSQLTRLPWEYLYDTTRDDFFALSIQTPIVRYVDLPIPESSMQVEDPLHILVMIADPVDLQPRLDVDREWIQLRSTFQDLEDAHKIKLHRLPNATRRELQRYLRGNRIDIFHFIGHSHFDALDGEGQLAFEDNQRQAELVSADVLARLLRDEMPNLVYLNSCDTAQSGPYDPLTGTAQKLVQHGIPAVVAMQTAIQDDKAIQIAHEFYLALTDGYPVDAALVEGRKAVFNNNGLSQWGTPVLFMRAPDGILWDQEKIIEGDNKLSDVSLPPPTKNLNFIYPSLADRNKRNKRYATTIGAYLLGLIALLIAASSYLMPPNIPPTPTTESTAALTANPTTHPTSIPTATRTLTAILTPTGNSTPVENATSMPTSIPTMEPTPVPPISIPTAALTLTAILTSTGTSIPVETITSTISTVTSIAVPIPGALSCTNVNDIPSLECEALVALYENTDGPNWDDNSGWLEHETACSWYGITCQKGRVVRLRLGGPWDGFFGLIGDIPAEIGNLTNLNSLNLSWNKLHTIPKEIGQLSKLGELYLTGNQITALPEEIGQLSTLSRLSIGINPLETIPAAISQLSRLEYLDLRESQLSTLPAEIGDLARLEVLTLDKNRLNSLPAEIGDLSRLITFSLKDNQLSTLPSEISNLSNLNKLDLNNNRFDEWPVEINGLANLTSLFFGSNLLEIVPAEIGALSNLEVLYLSHNSLEALPAQIENLLALQRFDLSNNNLQSLPTGITSLTRLKKLRLDGNSLATLPAEIGKLILLEELDISDNLLLSLPAEIGNFTNLSSLNLNKNFLNTLPTSFVKLINVEKLYLKGNQLEVEDPALLDWMNAKDPDWDDN